MYLQIIEQIRQRIAVGDWPAGEPLPSIRQLATDLGVSTVVNTAVDATIFAAPSGGATPAPQAPAGETR